MKLTENAAHMISELVDQQDLPAGAGLRIAEREDHPALAMQLAEAAGPDDRVVSENGADVFLTPVADVRLAAQTLDARVNEVGSAFFLQP